MKRSSTVKLLVPAGKASPSPPVGPALGQRGVKAMDFCKLFNDKTKEYVPNIPMRVILTVKPDKTFSFVLKTPPTSWLLKQAAGVEKGTSRPSHVEVGKVSIFQVYEIAKIKMNDEGNSDSSLEAMTSRIISQAKAMGLQVSTD